MKVVSNVLLQLLSSCLEASTNEPLNFRSKCSAHLLTTKSKLITANHMRR